MIVLNFSDLINFLSVVIPGIIMLISSKIFVENLINENKEFRYFLIGSTFIFYIAFVYPFMYINIYLGIAFYWIISFFGIAYALKFSKLKNKFVFDFKIHKSALLLIILMMSNLIFVTYWDATFHISHSFVDAFYNYLWIKGNLENLGTVSYYPGLTIASALPFTIFDPKFNLNIFSASFGTLVLLSINLILRYILNLRSLVIFNVILLSPFFYPLTFTRIGLNNSILFPVIFFALIIFVIHDWKDKGRNKIYYFCALAISAFVTAPHILILVLPGIIIASITVSGISLKRNKNILYLGTLTLGALIFANILGGKSELLKSVTDQNPNLSKHLSPISDVIVNSQTSNLIVNLLFEWIRIKFPIRNPFESLNALSVYLILVIALVTLIRSRKIENYTLTFIATITLVFGISIQTGIGEFSIMKGRIGWYFMYTTALLCSMIFQEFLQKRKSANKLISTNPIIFSVLIINLAAVIYNPPSAYRYANENVFVNLRKIVAEDKRLEVNIYSDVEKLEIVSPKINVISNNPSNLNLLDYIVLNNNASLPDSSLANQRQYEDRDLEKFKLRATGELNERLKRNRILTQNALRSGYEILVEDVDYVILKKLL
jgi:hypothetical protein